MNFTKLVSRQEYEEWFNNETSDKCLLCDPSTQIVIKEFKYWTWIVNPSPYWGYHTMLIPKRHIEHMSEINSKEWKEYRDIYDLVLERYKQAAFKHPDGSDIVKYLIIIRARDYTLDHSMDIARPKHLHIHFLPDKKDMFAPQYDSNASKIPMEEFDKLK